MEPSNNEDIAHEFRFFKVYKDGRLEMFNQIHTVPPSDDPLTGVKSLDVVISSQPSSLSVRIFLPIIHDPTRRLPLLFHIHGGGFCFESAFSLPHRGYLSTLAAEANAIVVSVEYGLFPDRPIPACYEDSWAGLQWVATHVNGDGPETWLNEHADFGRVFIGGDSAGGNISHNLVVRVGSMGLLGVKVVGMVLVHPCFGGTDDDKMWLYMCPSNDGLDDPRLKPSVQDLAKLGCDKALVFVSEKDHLRVVGQWYYDELKRSGWKGNVDIVENKDEGHCFHIENLTSENSVALIKRCAAFIKD
ncbi:2-hydroxyisoflavanone dehydratase [Ricinus communis]|uniref:Gibberellin receptor GID1, putative n=1 Tax=Ricinus communis TaxID=3988 RepID=B9RYG8_RICCO|nr:2-hydroxyisoflavanone dehydratase [Ricinus communis]EEF43677.1 Gibberellin receptor GID1, putative [Ricinus communis]|eukprot:XP_002518752.1 2-hydroxyisoflavanone dehydratase [Ricinus communis]